jgi:prepilin-type N-terminal cleavage/methylation domain-containing protein
MKSRAGFTLIELIVFVAIFSVAMGAFMNIFTSVSGIAVRQSSVAEVQSQSQFILQTIQHYIERSSMVSTTVDEATPTLVLRMSSSTEDPIVINMNGTAIQLKIGAAAAQNITSSRIEVSGLSFARRSNPGGKDSVSVSFVLSYATSNLSQRYSQSVRTSVSRVSAAVFDSNVIPDAGSSYKLGTSWEDWRSINDTIFFSSSTVGIGPSSFTPEAELHVQGSVKVDGGDLYTNSSLYGPILKSPNNSCWRMTVSDKGLLVGESVTTCP